MKNLLLVIVTLLAALPLARGQNTKFVFNNDPEQYLDSIVRIFAYNPDDPSKGIPTQDIPLNGVDFKFTPWSCGTGFVINNAGYIVTNNRVVAIDEGSRQAESVIYVVETVTTSTGKKRIVPKAKVLWMTPENDLAVIQCNNNSASLLHILIVESRVTIKLRGRQRAS